MLITPTALQFRLSQPDDEPIGRLEVNISGAWGPVCNSAKDEAFAQMACNAMGSHRYTLD